jgi:hypothetical protein
MEKKIICGIEKRKFWVAHYDCYEVKTFIKVDAYSNSGDFSDEMSTLLKEHNLTENKIHLCSPVNAVCDILTEERIEKYLTSEKTNELLEFIHKQR